MVLDRKSLHKYPVISGVSQDSILGPALSLLYINNLHDINGNIAVYASDTTLHSKYDHTSGLWQQLEFASEFESGSYLDMLGKLEKQVSRTVDPSLTGSLEPLAHCQNVANLSLFDSYYFCIN